MGAIRKSVGKDAELGTSPPAIRVHSKLTARTVFVDAPHILQPADLAATFGTPDSFDSEAAAADGDPALLPRAWWKTDATRSSSIGLEESLAALREVLRGARFDVRALGACARATG
jgi:hypothetical protein